MNFLFKDIYVDYMHIIYIKYIYIFIIFIKKWKH